MRAGIQVGIGEGRPELSGIGWGTFELDTEPESKRKERKCRKVRRTRRA
jgi:hypothetical protein